MSYRASRCHVVVRGVFTIGPLGPCPPFELQKNLAYEKNATKCAIFRQKSQKFSGEGAVPPPQTLPQLGREIPLTRPLTLGAAALDPLQIFPQFLSGGLPPPSEILNTPLIVVVSQKRCNAM